MARSRTVEEFHKGPEAEEECHGGPGPQEDGGVELSGMTRILTR